MGLFSSLPGRAWASLGIVLVLSTALGGLYFHARSVGVTACERDQLKAVAKAEKEGAVRYEAALAWGNNLSGQLVQTQRRLTDARQEYLAYANGIAGNCPVDVGVLSNAAASGSEISAATGGVHAPGQTIEADYLAESIAENYAIANGNAAQLTLLQTWVRGVIQLIKEGSLK